MKILGYSDRLSVQPGGTIEFMVSSQLPRYEVRTVRLVGAVEDLGGLPGEVRLRTNADGRYEGRPQAIATGSYVIVADHPLLRLEASFTLQAWLWPTRPGNGRVQGLVSKYSAGRRAGYRLVLTEGGDLALELGDGERAPTQVGTGKALRPGEWYFVACAYNGDAERVTLYQQPLSRWLEHEAVRLSRSGVYAKRGAWPLTPAEAVCKRWRPVGAPAKTIGVGFVGHGWMGRVHAHALHTINHMLPLPARVRFVAISGRHAERVERVAGELGFERWRTSWEQVVEDPEVDVVANLTPPGAHAAPSIAALELGKPVLCEKPLARNGAEAREMLAAAEAAGVTNSCAFNYRFVPAVRLAHDLVASGKLGRLRQMRACYLQNWAASPSVPRDWRFVKEENASGAATNYSHIVDLLRWFVGEPRAVSAHVATFIAERPDPAESGELLPVEVHDAYGAVFDVGGGALATLEASSCATGRKGGQVIELYGSEGALWWDMDDLNRLHVFFESDEREGLGGFRDILVTEREHPYLQHWWAPGHILGWEHTFVHQWLEFLSACLERRPVGELQASFADGYRTAVVCDAIVTSAESGRRVELAEAVDEPQPSASAAGAHASR